MSRVEVVELKPGDERLPGVWEVMRELRSHLDEADLAAMYDEAYVQGYRVVALSSDGRCRAAASYRLGTSFANGRYLYVEDLVTSADHRSGGYGKRLLDHLVEVAHNAGCVCVTLDSGVHRFGAHRFYMREGFVISSHHFYRALGDGAQASSMREGT